MDGKYLKEIIMSKRNRKPSSDLSRRKFIKNTAIGVGETALIGLNVKSAKAIDF